MIFQKQLQILKKGYQNQNQRRDLGGVGQRFMSVALKDKKFDFFEIIS